MNLHNVALLEAWFDHEQTAFQIDQYGVRFLWSVDRKDGSGATGMAPTLEEAKRLAMAFADTGYLQPSAAKSPCANGERNLCSID
jgi:hypothetical protein